MSYKVITLKNKNMQVNIYVAVSFMQDWKEIVQLYQVDCIYLGELINVCEIWVTTFVILETVFVKS